MGSGLELLAAVLVDVDRAQDGDDLTVGGQRDGTRNLGTVCLSDSHDLLGGGVDELYPILRRLEAAELLTVRSAEHNGRLRKYYHITQRGLERIRTFREEWKEIISIYQFVTKENSDE